MICTVQAQVEGRTLDEFARLIEARSKFLNQSTDKACTACMIDVLKSIRALTKVAKLNPRIGDIKSRSDLIASFYRQGGKNYKCIRQINNIRFRPDKKNRVVFANHQIDLKVERVFEWVDDRGDKSVTYFIVATSVSEAKKWAKAKVKRRIAAHKGLAKRALGKLMYNVSGAQPKDQVSGNVDQIANKNTRATKSVQSGRYSLDVYDDLKYAISALKGGANDINLAMQKASNSIAAKINKACENILSFNRIETPFPEIKK